MDQALYQNHLGILREELLVALGCTEPIALAYSAALAREALGMPVEFKDGLRVTTPEVFLPFASSRLT